MSAIGKYIQVINYASYKAYVVEKDGQIVYRDSIDGMWDIDRYISLLMGEIPRLTDDEDGYGPVGKDYIAHEDIPECVVEAFSYLKEKYLHLVREANSEFAEIKKR